MSLVYFPIRCGGVVQDVLDPYSLKEKASPRRNNIPTLLDQIGWSIYRLAKEVNMEHKSVHTLVNSEKIPSQTHHITMRKIADALGVNIDGLEANVESGQG